MQKKLYSNEVFNSDNSERKMFNPIMIDPIVVDPVPGKDAEKDVAKEQLETWDVESKITFFDPPKVVRHKKMIEKTAFQGKLVEEVVEPLMAEERSIQDEIIDNDALRQYMIKSNEDFDPNIVSWFDKDVSTVKTQVSSSKHTIGMPKREISYSLKPDGITNNDLANKMSLADQIPALKKASKATPSLKEAVALLGPGNALKKAEEQDAKNTPKEDITPYESAQKLLSMIHFKMVDNALYYYNKICYKHLTYDELSRLIVETIRYDVSKPTGYTNFPMDTRRWLMIEPTIVCTPKMQTHLVAFRNGVLNLNTGIFTESSPDYFITSYVDADYDVNASENTPVFDAFLYKSFDGTPELIQRVWEILGYLLTNDMSAKIFILLQGVPNSGKSVLGRFISSFFDSSTTSSVDIFTLGERFAVYNLVGKRINASLDLPAGKLSQQAVSVIKQLTGNDPLTAEAKYENSFKFENTCKLVFATNHPICLAEADEAFENRCLVVPFRHSVPKCEQDFHLLEKFNSEKPGIIKKALHSYQMLRANSYVFSGEEYVKMNYKEFMSEDKIVKQFIDLCCEFTGLDDGAFTCVLYDKYANYCKNYGYPTITNIVKFSETLKRICGDKISAAKWRNKSIKDGPQNGYRGIKIK